MPLLLLFLLFLIFPAAAQLRQVKSLWPADRFESLGILVKSDKIRVEGYRSPDNPRMHVTRDRYRFKILGREDAILGKLDFRTHGSPEAKFILDEKQGIAGRLVGSVVIFLPPSYQPFQVEILRFQKKKLRTFRVSDISWQPDSLVCFGTFQPNDRWNGNRGFPFISTIEIDSKGIRNHRLIWTTWHEGAEQNKTPDAYQHLAHQLVQDSLHVEGNILFWLRSGLPPRFGEEAKKLSCRWMTTNLKTGETEVVSIPDFQEIAKLASLTELQVSRLISR